MKKRIPVAGVIGDPVAHSKSPVLHGHWLRSYGISGHYVPLHVQAPDLREVIAALVKSGFVGANVTLPHKEAVLGLADETTDRAQKIGAANTLVFSPENGVVADNTDGYGFIANLKQNAPDWRGDVGPAVVLGAGGAARAVLVALIEDGATDIRLCNRTRSRADDLKSAFGDEITVVRWGERSDALDGARTIVNTSSLGMTGAPPLEIELERVSEDALVTDIVYTPLETSLLKTARERGCTTVDGLGMLLHQAVPGFHAWFGHEPEVDDDVRQAVLDA